MGKFSRDKGARGERNFRDAAIREGYTARRIPLSGASEGFKGDVVFEKDGKSFKAEVKCRKDSFKLLYEYVFKYGSSSVVLENLPYSKAAPSPSKLARVSFNLDYVLNHDGGFSRWNDGTRDKFYRKVLKLSELLGEADILVVKDDRKPFIYIRYL